MSKKHYIQTAEIIKSELAIHRDSCGVDVDVILHATAARLADMFARDNPRFDRFKFMAACGTGR